MAYCTDMKKNILVVAATVAGIALIALAALYWTTPAGALPSYIPGFIEGSATIHYKHGLASVLLGLALFAFSWFSSAKKPGPLS